MEAGDLTPVEKDKALLRREINSVKKQYPKEILDCKSDIICKRLAETEEFRNAHKIALYHSLPDEVQTHSLLERYYKEKELFLPVIAGNEIVFYGYSGINHLKTGTYNIKEPDISGAKAVDLSEIELFVAPGVMFDRNLNRLGRGKGFYDRMLAHVNKPVIGLSFEFRIFDKIPVNQHDVKMTKIISEDSFLTL